MDNNLTDLIGGVLSNPEMLNKVMTLMPVVMQMMNSDSSSNNKIIETTTVNPVNSSNPAVSNEPVQTVQINQINQTTQATQTDQVTPESLMANEKTVEKKNISREEFLEEYYAPRKKNKLPRILTKREKKKLGIGRDEGRAMVPHIRISARKVKIVLDLIRGKQLDEAYGIVRYTPKAASEVIYKLLKSAEANAVNDPNKSLDRDSLYVAETYANQGITMKRTMPKARGSANRINKRSSHITVVLKEKK